MKCCHDGADEANSPKHRAARLQAGCIVLHDLGNRAVKFSVALLVCMTKAMDRWAHRCDTVAILTMYEVAIELPEVCFLDMQGVKL